MIQTHWLKIRNPKHEIRMGSQEFQVLQANMKPHAAATGLFSDFGTILRHKESVAPSALNMTCTKSG